MMTQTSHIKTKDINNNNNYLNVRANKKEKNSLHYSKLQEKR